MEKKLGLFSVVSTGVGLIVATTCLMSLCQGAASIGGMFIVSVVLACALNMITAASLAELNALMPNLTGGLAQYTLAGLGPFVTLVSMVGGYIVCNALMAPSEGAMFGLAIKELTGAPISTSVISVALTAILIVINLFGVDMFAKIQNVVAFLLIGSLLLLGIIGAVGAGTGAVVSQSFTLTDNVMDGVNMAAAAFWLFIGAEFAIPISKDVKNAKRNVPLGMSLGLLIILVMQIIMVLGFYHYTPWADLMNSAAPHMLYGEALLGNTGKIWMAFVAALAVVSTQNSGVNGLAHIGEGMAKMNMLPQIFAKTNKRGCPYVGVILISVSMFLFAYISDGSSNMIEFLILVGSVFWMITYIFAHIDVLILRRKMPKAPRSFKIPLGPIIPLIGILGTSYMIFYISNDMHERLMIWAVTGVSILALGIYAYFWTKFKMRMPVWKSVPIEKVMAMDDSRYYPLRRKPGFCKPKTPPAFAGGVLFYPTLFTFPLPEPFLSAEQCSG